MSRRSSANVLGGIGSSSGVRKSSSRPAAFFSLGLKLSEPGHVWLSNSAHQNRKRRRAKWTVRQCALQNPERLRSELGLVSRVSPVHTATRNCTGDEGGPFGFGDQSPIPSHRQRLWSKAMVVSVAETSGR